MTRTGIEACGRNRLKTPAVAVMIMIEPLAGAVGLVVLAVARLASGGML